MAYLRWRVRRFLFLKKNIQYENFLKKDVTIEEICIIVNFDLTRFCEEEKVFCEKLFELMDECDKINELYNEELNIQK